MDEALCFDMYGTLCDTSSVTATLADELDAADGLVDAVDARWRATQLRYSFLLVGMGRYRPFWDVTADALDYALDYYELDPDEETRERILASYNHLEPFDDALDALADLHEAGYELAVLSNGSPPMLETLAANAGFEPILDAVVSAHEVETFKPAPAVYENAAARLDRDLAACRLVSSNAWDVAGAAAAGMGTAWVNRSREPSARVGGAADLMASTLVALAEEL